MKLLNRLSLGAKLSLAPLVAITSLVIVALLTTWLGMRLLEAQRAMNEVNMPRMERIQALDGAIKGLQGQVMQTLSWESIGQKAERIAELDSRILKELDQYRKELQSVADDPGISTEQRTQVAELSKVFDVYDKTVRETLDIKSAGVATAASFVFTLDAEYANASKLLRDMVTAEKAGVANLVSSNQESALGGAMFLLVVMVVAVSVSVLLSWATHRAIVQPLRRASDFARTVAEGDLTKSMEVPSRDVVGDLVQSMNDMRKRLLELVSGVRESAENVATASAEIASGNADLSTRTESQAASLEETSASMQQMVDAIARSAETASSAAQLSGSALNVANDGGSVVAQVVETMQRITDSSRKMAEIIAVIDGIAFQTNILALNAAVEAARAGEQGRGFAVVAGEVRSLAQRSAQAAKEIKTLIDVSVERVDEGQSLVQVAGKTMSEIVGQVNQVSQLIAEINTSSTAQAMSAREINQAVVSLDQGTQQNAALVEESAAASESLKRQSADLISLMAVFRT
ncbi:methyl-accepting chemotaxis protein [Hydrogenophaga flava]|uniref:methyl-accepting chemotaxis protein n=1 Tax=Hydrogenophaga flava TaxID=65657 RepID=UPI00082415B7|nr:methyl-accepting chemotaxis protein [Hydrogenophaga flava]